MKKIEKKEQFLFLYLYLFGTAKGGMETAFSGRVSLVTLCNNKKRECIRMGAVCNKINKKLKIKRGCSA